MLKKTHLLLGSALLLATQWTSILRAEEEAAQPAVSEAPVAAEVAAVPAAPIEVPENELIELLGYLTAQGGGVASLKLDEAGTNALAEGLKKELAGNMDVMSLPREEVEAAFGQAQARAEAVQSGAEELPAITPDALENIGAVMVLQSGLAQLGFGADEAVLIHKGFVQGAGDKELSAEMQAKMPAFQKFIQTRVQAAQAKMAAEREAAAADNIAEGKAFFEKLRTQEGVESSESGLYFKVLEKGSDQKATMGDTVLVHYKGTLIDGTQFDSSYDRGEPATFPLSGVVQGFGEGLTKVGEGGKIILYIPSELGYGNNPRPGGLIEPGDTLIFECELIKINPGS